MRSLLSTIPNGKTWPNLAIPTIEGRAVFFTEGGGLTGAIDIDIDLPGQYEGCGAVVLPVTLPANIAQRTILNPAWVWANGEFVYTTYNPFLL